MTCRECKKAEPVYGSTRCAACLPAAEEQRKAKQRAYWNKYRAKNKDKLNAYMREYKPEYKKRIRAAK